MANSLSVVTGALGHIGRATCRKLAADGSDIVVLDRDEKMAAEFAALLQTEYGVQSSGLGADLMEEDVFAKVASSIEGEYERLDCLVNCAAFYDDTPGWGVPFEQETYDAWLKVLRVNTMAPFFLTQKLYPLLKKSKQSSVINVSSIYGIVAPNASLYSGTEMSNPAAYGASKGGLQQITRWLSTSLSPHVRVNTVTPGGVERGQDSEFRRRYHERTPLGRMAVEDDIAEAIVFLASPKSKYITGHNLVVDGGWTVW